MLQGKIAVITGGSRGIGRAVALRLASLGADIAIIYAGNEKKAEEVCEAARQLGVRASAYQCNVADFEVSAQTIAAIKKDFGTVNILVNNAGITKDGLILTMKEEAYDSVIDTNLKGTFNMIRHCAPLFVKQRSGKIINISSVAGVMGNAGQTNYAASKAGIIGLTKSVAKELAARNVCCNAIAPGFIETDMTEAIDECNELMKYIPLKRMGKPEEVAELVAFLAQDAANYITGEVIRIDGGMAM